MGASAASLDVTQTLKSHCFSPTDTQGGGTKNSSHYFLLDSNQKNDLENSTLFKKVARTKAASSKLAILCDKTNNYLAAQDNSSNNFEQSQGENLKIFSFIDAKNEAGTDFILNPTSLPQAHTRNNSIDMDLTPCFGQSKACNFIITAKDEYPLAQSPMITDEASAQRLSIGKEYRVGSVRIVDVRQRQLY